jgi:glycosyltransferase involved in cell wall biosynthesis
MIRMYDHPKIAIFASFSGKGGVERMIVNLCEGLVALNCQVHLVIVKAQSKHLDSLPSTVNVVKLPAAHTMSSLPALVTYLRRERPIALLAAKDRANQVAVIAKHLPGVSTRVVVRMGTTVSAALAGQSLIRKWLWYLPMRLIYPLADAIVAVSHGVAHDLSKIAGLPLERIQVIPNPVITPGLARLAVEPVAHPWFGNKRTPVILGIGRLTRQKDFSTLIKAFATVRAKRQCRLLIIGEGRDRLALEALAAELGLRDDVNLPGFVENPYAYMSRSALFVLSSLWEGSPNVLTEALALGVPVVATDCPSGPREILAGGRHGHLVPMGDPEALAKAILETLANPPEKDALVAAVREYTSSVSSKRYLDALLGPVQVD